MIAVCASVLAMAPRLLALALALQLLPAATAQKKPNFLILFLDDHGWGDMGANANSVEVCVRARVRERVCVDSGRALSV